MGLGVNAIEKIKEKKTEEEDREEVKKNIQKYTYKGPYGTYNYNRYDGIIEKIVNDWNNEFLNDKYPPKKPLDPSLVKAIIYKESKMGYYPGGEINVMQAGNLGDPSIHILNNDGMIKLKDGEVAKEYEIKEGKLWLLDYYGEANSNSVKESIKWGTRWLYHKAQGIKNDKRYWKTWEKAVFGYGPNTQEYVNEVWGIYKKGIDNYKGKTIKLWSIILISLLLGSASLYLHLNQGQVYFKYKDIGEKHIWTGRAWLDIGILDGLRIKKGRVGPINDRELGSHGLIKDSILVDYYDLDNDGKDDVMVSAKNSTGDQVRFFFQIGLKKLEIIPTDSWSPMMSDNNMYGNRIMFGPRDKYNRYSFVEESDVWRAYNEYEIWREYYKFNNKGKIVLYKKEIENVIL